MYKITFCDADTTLTQTGLSLECKAFSETCANSPSDRHAYSLKFFKNPITVGRLPLQTKNFLKFIR